MITITRTFEWDMGHRVPNHVSLCKNPHGHRYRADITIGGLLVAEQDSPEQDMIVDFGVIKKLINDNVIEPLDHAFMYASYDKIYASFVKTHSNFKTVKVSFTPTAERIAEFVALETEKAIAQHAPSLRVIAVDLYETPKSKATWTA